MCARVKSKTKRSELPYTFLYDTKLKEEIIGCGMIKLQEKSSDGEANRLISVVRISRPYKSDAQIT
jgi:hypothetical protein